MHHLLETAWSRLDSRLQLIDEEKTTMCVDGQQLHGIVVELDLEESIWKIRLTADCRPITQKSILGWETNIC